MKKDITEYSEDELSLIVFNDEGLYNERHDDGFLGLIDELFIYTDEQLEVLKNDLKDDEDENGEEKTPYFAVLPEHLNEV